MLLLLLLGMGDQKVPAACSSDTIKADIMKLTGYIYKRPQSMQFESSLVDV